MTTLTDAVARAIWPYSFSQYYEAYPNWDQASKEGKDNTKECARAAIAEFCRYLREPSEEMIWAYANGQFKWEGKYMPTHYREMCLYGLDALATHIEANMKECAPQGTPSSRKSRQSSSKRA